MAKKSPRKNKPRKMNGRRSAGMALIGSKPGLMGAFNANTATQVGIMAGGAFAAYGARSFIEKKWPATKSPWIGAAIDAASIVGLSWVPKYGNTLAAGAATQALVRVIQMVVAPKILALGELITSNDLKRAGDRMGDFITERTPIAQNMGDLVDNERIADAVPA